MADPLTTPIQLLTESDIQELVAGAYPESSRLKLKQTLPAKDGADVWVRGENRVGDRARDALLAEVVAFANAHGGRLVVGIVETTDEPKRAAAVAPVPRVADLAPRFEQQLRDCVDPPLLGVQARGIVTADDGAGALVVEVPESPSAPHRVTTTMECYHRRGTRSEKMDMRAIQDLTVLRLTAGQRIEARFAERSRLADRRVAAFAAEQKRENVMWVL